MSVPPSHSGPYFSRSKAPLHGSGLLSKVLIFPGEEAAPRIRARKFFSLAKIICPAPRGCLQAEGISHHSNGEIQTGATLGH